MEKLPLAAAFGVAAFLYSLVGHGGATAYLALGSLAGISPAELRPIALSLNVAVAGIAAWNFRSHFVKELFLPLAAASVPAAFLGAQAKLSSAVFAGLLGAVLLWSGMRLIFAKKIEDSECPLFNGSKTFARQWIAAPCAGAALGLLSGALGIGGGILLSPLLLSLRWATVKQTAAVSSAFIVVNSASGLVSSALAGQLPHASAIPFLLAATAGALAGAYVGAKRFSSRALAVALGIVLVTAAVKMIAASFRSV